MGKFLKQLLLRISVDHILLKLFGIFAFFFTLGSTQVSGQTPVANFTGSPLAGCSPMIINFQDLSTGSPTFMELGFWKRQYFNITKPYSILFYSWHVHC
jgi:hypothetical protein